MVTFDVTNLYSSISHELGKQDISFSIEKHPETLNPRFNKKIITDGIELIRNDKSFRFDNKNHITAMGTKITPTEHTYKKSI